jgi:hypothetical protein
MYFLSKNLTLITFFIKVPKQRNFNERFLDCIAKMVWNDYVASLVEFLWLSSFLGYSTLFGVQMSPLRHHNE